MPRTEPQDWVLLAACGCCVGVCTKRVAANEDKAWREFFPARTEERAAHQRGLTLKLMAHREWGETYADAMVAGCPHKAVAR